MYKGESILNLDEQNKTETCKMEINVVLYGWAIDSSKTYSE